jgi:hypothetical protein
MKVSEQRPDYVGVSRVVMLGGEDVFERLSSPILKDVFPSQRSSNL